MKTKQNMTMKVVTATWMVTALILMTACGGNQGNSTTEEELTEAPQTTVKPPDMDIHTATLMGDLEVIQQHVKAGSDLDVQEPSVGSTPLISAAVFGKTEVARALIEGGADVNLKNNEGSTALHSAAFLCRVEIVQMLLDHGVDKSVLNNYGSTAQASVSAPFSDVKFIYEQFQKDLGPLGFKLDFVFVEETRPKIAEMLN